MIKTYYIEVCGNTYMVEVEDISITFLESKKVKHKSEQKVSKNCIKNSPLFTNRREWFIKWL